MQNVKEFLKEATTFQEFCEIRGHELLMTLGCKWNMYKTPDKFEFEEDGVTMTFQENTRHDCPDYETICLKIEELEKTDEDWVLYIENAKKETAEKERVKKQNEEDRKLQEKERQFENLKKELGK
jgi:hypothetical protein